MPDDEPWLRVVVCGSREYRAKGAVFRVLDAVHAYAPIALIGEGGCRRYDRDRNLRPVSADLYAHQWSEYREVACLTIWARWGAEGLSAGPKRNARLLEAVNPHLLIAMPGGDGTKSMIRTARAAGFQQAEAQLEPATLFLSGMLPRGWAKGIRVKGGPAGG